MIRLDCDQGSPEWWAEHIGIPTASQFHRLVTPKTKKPSTGDKNYLLELVAAWMLGQPLDADMTDWTQRGKDLEARAVSWYEFRHDLDTERVGFCLTDDRQVGCSPDRLVGDHGLLEVKCLSAKEHVRYMLDTPEETDYYAQVQGELLVTEREWADFLCWHPQLPPALVRYHRDDFFQKLLRDVLQRFVAQLDEAKQTMIARGYHPPDEKVGGWLRDALARSIAG